MYCDFSKARLFCRHVTHQRVHELWEHPRIAESKEGMPVIRHDYKCAEINALLLDSKRESRNDDFAHCFIQNGFLRNQRLRDEECCWRVGGPMQAKVPGRRISFHEVGALRPLPYSQMP